MLKLPDGTVKVLVEGVQRARIERVLTEKPNFEAEIELIADRRAPIPPRSRRCAARCSRSSTST